MSRPIRIAIMGSHPIPYRVPLYRLLAKDGGCELLVLYGDDYGVTPRPSAWGVGEFTWDGDLASGYPCEFLPNWALRRDPSTMFGKLNPHLGFRLRSFRPDLVWVSGYRGLYQLQSIAASKLLGAGLLYAADTSACLDPVGWRGVAKHAVLEAVYRLVDGFLVSGEQNQRHYANFGVPAERMFEFPWAVDTASRPAPPRAKARARFGIPEDAFCVLYVGRLSPEKNVGVAIQAVARVPGAWLLVAGSGPEERELRALAKATLNGRHAFAGFANQGQLPSVYAAGDVLVLPSTYEPWGLVCNEALGFGLPIVVSDRVGAAPDLVETGTTGWVCRPGDIRGFAEALRSAERLVRDHRREVAQVTRNSVARYSYQQQRAGLLAAAQAILARRGGQH